MAGVVGREHELSVLGRFVAESRERSAVLVLEGEAGIGKTTVWREGAQLADEAGFGVLAARPAEAEATLAFASIGDLFARVGDDVFAQLPEPQRHAIDVALLRTSSTEAAVDARAVGTALTTVLTGLAAESPVLVAIDDAQWLDRASAAALAFAARRVDAAARVSFLVAARVARGERADVLGLDAEVERLRIGPLNLSALYHVVDARTGVAFPRPALQRIEQASGGNPLFAIELARALADAQELPGPGEALPVPDTLAGLIRGRLTGLDDRTRETLLAVALLATPRVHLVERALGRPVDDAFEHAHAAGLIEFRDTLVRFAHPLLAAEVAASATPSRRRTMHRRLAAVAESDEQRARHLALGADGPDETVAAAVEDAARGAERRGAPDAAAELLDLALRATPPGGVESRARRRVELARALFRAGDTQQAADTLDALLAEEIQGPVRARALEIRAQVHWVAGGAAPAEACCEEGLGHAGDDHALRARLLTTLARVTLDIAQQHARAETAIEFLDGLDVPDPRTLSEALVALAEAEFYAGNGIRTDIVERALELERVSPPANVGDRMSAALGAFLKYAGDFDGARHWLEVTRQAAIDEGDEGSLPYALSHLPQLELWTGRWQESEARALEHLDLAERTGQTLERFTALSSLATIRAHRGDLDGARQLATDALTEAETADPWSAYQHLSVLGFVELAAGNAAPAVAALARALELYEESGARDTPSVYENYPEALVLAGDVDRAQAVVDVYEARARNLGKPMSIAAALRCRALVLSARQDLTGAVQALDEALGVHEKVEVPFSLGRTLLVLGRVRRRLGERRAAKDALDRALAIFDELGAPPWAAQTREELARIPIRRRSETGSLTPGEQRVATLVAQGLSNREIAQALFMSQKTVEANLTRIYRKLQLPSRAALVAHLVSKT